MIVVNCFADQNVVILGLGRTGMSAARSLQVGGAEVYVWDDNSLRRAEASSLGFSVTDPFLIDWKTISALVLSPGIPHTYPKPHPIVLKARSAGVPILSDIDLLGRTQIAAKYIGVTGTNGKSSTTALIGHILATAKQKVQVGGNIGVPALSLEPLVADGIYVIEMSSYLNELTCSISFDVAVLLNITPDHLDRHGDMEGYVAAKKLIFQNQKSGSSIVVGVDDAHSVEIYHELKSIRLGNVIPISAKNEIKGGIYFHQGILVDDSLGTQDIVLQACEAEKFSPGLHRQNICAAYAVCRHIGLSRSDILEGARTFQGMPHRQEVLGLIDNVMYVNDSKATNMVAAKEALGNFDNIFWILGGRPKGDSLSLLSEFFPKVRKAFLIGEAIKPFSEALAIAGVNFVESGDLAQAVLDARKAALASGIDRPTVLLSPACPSFDQFQNFEERGNTFSQIVKELPGLHTSSSPHQVDKRTVGVT